MPYYLNEINRALELDKKGDREKSLAVLAQVVDTIPGTDVKSLVLVGSLFRQSNVLPKAVSCFQTAKLADPSSSSASIGLFHSLWRSEQFDDAFDEMERFFRLSRKGQHQPLDEGEYSRLLNEMSSAYFDKEGDKPEDPLKLIEALRLGLNE